MTVSKDEVLELLRSWEAGDPQALTKLMPLVCGDVGCGDADPLKSELRAPALYLGRKR